ncbi:replication initiation and membrane attachment family protein [Salibacterium qingdaonense]|uniref:Replicative DNA helicase loader DnaB n=1 Tax=Salibacterium qingdaonense TaxID=266892 RepID=A0A1I4NP91_9BACI|nr:DnaD domain protein [Salibacterium qingdaonense]SFM17344.1 replicative DNA helicase loader DnaB [Salibacterium qingdaonense]
MPHWTELLPVDRFKVQTADQLGEREHKTLQLLYQPLIGTTAVSLYTMFWSKLEKDSFTSSESVHHELMAMLNQPLDDIYEARRGLEGIGLLRTFQRKEETSTLFVYELQPPMTPAQFFQNDVLSVFLFNRLGKNRYIELRRRFMMESVDKEAYTEVTAAFNDIYTSLHHSEMVSAAADTETEYYHAYQGLVHQGDLPFRQEDFDFELLKADLPVFIDGDKLLDEQAKRAIQRMAFVYRLQPLQISRIVQRSLDNEEKLDEQEFRRQVQEWYRNEYGNEPPALGRRTQPEEHRMMDDKEPADENDQMAVFCEQTSPVTFLETIADGAKVPQADVKLVESLMHDYQLQPGVVNVLIDYVMRMNNMKLNQNFVQKIAGQWARKQINTVKDAMQLAKWEYQQQKHRGQAKAAQAAGTQPRPYVRKDKLPKWLEQDKQNEQAHAKASGAEDEEKLNKEKQQFEEMLRLRKSSRQQ